MLFLVLVKGLTSQGRSRERYFRLFCGRSRRPKTVTEGDGEGLGTGSDLITYRVRPVPAGSKAR